jgi:hypothetical protein
MLMLVWMVLPKIASEVTYLWVPVKVAGLAAALGTMAAMAAFACMPRPSPARLALLEGMLLWAMLIMIIAVVRVFFAVISIGLVAGLSHQLTWIGYGAGALALASLAQCRIGEALAGADE